MRFFFEPGLTPEQLDKLPALVPRGEDRAAKLNEVVEGWCGSTNNEDIDAHVQAGGYVLDRVALWDENPDTVQADGRRGQPIDLGDLLRMVEERLRAAGAPPEFQPHPDLHILLRDCRVHTCQGNELLIRPRFTALRVLFDVVSFADATFGPRASFSGARFGEGPKFYRATFGQRTDFSEATFGKRADFFGATFDELANFVGATFDERAYFSCATFSKRTNFNCATFGEQADFNGAAFGEQANFFGATFGQRTDFSEATFGKRADFDSATFGKGTSFCFASFDRPVLSDVDLSGADLRNTRGLILDRTLVRGARFSPLARDPWSVLRRAYTGPKLFFNLLFLAAFFLPYVAKTAYWVGVNRSEERAAAAVEALREKTDVLAEQSPHVAQWLDEGLDKVALEIPGPQNPRSRESRVWRVVMGVDNKGILFWFSAFALIGYNALRAALTAVVAPMRDEEERSGHTPRYRAETWDERPENVSRLRQVWWWCWSRRSEAYGWLIWPHRVATVLLLFAVVSFVGNAIRWLSLPVWLPP